MINDVASAYHEGISAQVLQLIEAWEVELNQQVGIMDSNMEDCSLLCLTLDTLREDPLSTNKLSIYIG